ncbi:cobyrinic acid a,c-diamide synthase [Ureibacillus massiliensis 4400831 = CIP 108448 = CCUG 49529]|uniref:Cobyrinate a,c-diamide synthase n=1 Tax=Ureibacillus massiliensis 4400831 = CIP 108448 = CCUG 49529 TaxID=1211035 RepID=A0A0A3J977_9BACL|nr:cobyrinate a,c-diamide synthase [Ureibacillus massiliensis]KGR92305.1 cobyrinic acid a,c-diamide synthase [Ureibacillus massiliensis 4400831 = CIP 108448 = CCUG 49529]
MGRRIVIAGTGSGVGKTTLTIGIMAALRKKGLAVQGFKCGPDYIDPTYHTAVTKRVSRNLDSWMLTKERVMEVFIHGSQGSDISVIEGVMGFYDGKNPESNEGSTAEISMILKSPVILVVNCESMARSAAAIVKGFQMFSDGPKLAAVIANKVGSEGHYQLVKKAIEQECKVPVIGYVKRDMDIEIPERHLGLIPSIERGELEPFFEKLGDLITETIDLDKLLEIAEAEPLKISETGSLFIGSKEKIAKIAVARDAAFNFYYPENLEIMEAKGVKLVYFSPLKDEELPSDVEGLYIGGGFPEEFAYKLEGNEKAKHSIKRAIENGLPTLAECGGFMYLTESIETTDKKQYKMVGVIPGKVKMQQSLAALGYREIRGLNSNYLLSDLTARGHEFHYSTYQNLEGNRLHAYETRGMRGVNKEGYLTQNLVAGYTHFHFASNPAVVDNWIRKCLQYKKSVSFISFE